ncbi:hypothetical protein [Streptomyces sp. YKOK-I1]
MHQLAARHASAERLAVRSAEGPSAASGECRADFSAAPAAVRTAQATGPGLRDSDSLIVTPTSPPAAP